MENILTPISLTNNALKEIKNILKNSNTSNKQLRIGVKGGGCSGLSYILELDEKKEDDEVYLFEGIEVLISTSHLVYLNNMEIDYEQGLNARGFSFKNPNASKTCGCGTSFAV